MADPGSTGDSVGREFELIETATHQLGALSEALLRLGLQLDINEIPEDTWGSVVRTLRLIHGLNSRRLIAVAGGQGVGKTHLMRNLYPSAAGWLEGNLGRGEKNVVAVEEREDCTEPFGVVVRRRRWDRNGRKADTSPGDELTYETVYGFDQREAWRKTVLGDGVDVVLAVLVVPSGFLGADGWGFALLPGFERVPGTHWQNLMKIVLATSPVALVVVDGTGLADATQAEVLKHLRDTGGQDIEFVVAVSRCEELEKTPEIHTQRIQRSTEVYGVDEEDVIAIGHTREDPDGWPDALRDALGRIRTSSAQSRRMEAALLRQVVRRDVQTVVNVAKNALGRMALGGDLAAEIQAYMDVFDTQCDELRASLRGKVRATFSDHHKKAGDRLKEELKKDSAFTEGSRRAKELLWMRPDEWAVRLTDLVDKAWDPQTAQKLQRTVIEQVINELWKTNGAPFVQSLAAKDESGNKLLALLAGRLDHRPDTDAQKQENHSRREILITPVLRALPGAALEARALALRLAGPDGKIAAAPDDRKLHEIVNGIAEDHRQLLAAFSVLLGGKQPEPGKGDVSSSLTAIAKSAERFGGVARRLLSGGGTAIGATATASALTAGAGTAGTGAAVGVGAVGTVAGVGTAVGAEAVGATAGTVATASLAVALSAVAVGALGAVVIHSGNRAMRERNRLASARLSQWRIATEASILDNTDELLRITRNIVEIRLRIWLGADNHLDQRFMLRQAVTEVSQARGLLLETLGDDHLA